MVNEIIGGCHGIKKKNHHQQLSRNLPQQTIVKVGRRFSNQGNRGENRKYFNQGNFKTNKQHLAANKKNTLKNKKWVKTKGMQQSLKATQKGKQFRKRIWQVQSSVE